MPEISLILYVCIRSFGYLSLNYNIDFFGGHTRGSRFWSLRASPQTHASFWVGFFFWGGGGGGFETLSNCCQIAGSIGILPCCVLSDIFHKGVWTFAILRFVFTVPMLKSTCDQKPEISLAFRLPMCNWFILKWFSLEISGNIMFADLRSFCILDGVWSLKTVFFFQVRCSSYFSLYETVEVYFVQVMHFGCRYFKLCFINIKVSKYIYNKFISVYSLICLNICILSKNCKKMCRNW